MTVCKIIIEVMKRAIRQRSDVNGGWGFGMPGRLELGSEVGSVDRRNPSPDMYEGGGGGRSDCEYDCSLCNEVAVQSSLGACGRPLYNTAVASNAWVTRQKRSKGFLSQGVWSMTMASIFRDCSFYHHRLPVPQRLPLPIKTCLFS